MGRSLLQKTHLIDRAMVAAAAPYVGRFAPSPTGCLHAGSLVTALASWLDAQAHGGRWLVRIEDVDTPRCVAGAHEAILAQLAACGLQPDDAPWLQSKRGTAYERALQQLQRSGATYPCACSRKDIRQPDATPIHAPWVYPGTCRSGLGGRPPRAVRLRCGTVNAPVIVQWHDRRLGVQLQNVTTEVGDFVLKRADGLWAYQLAVVVDDAAQGITHVVRGEDLADNTPRQIHLYQQMGLPVPRYLHTPLVRDAAGKKLSKSSDAPPLHPGFNAVQEALHALGLPRQAATLGELLANAVQAWRESRIDAKRN
jgi:glutamyl-Q tRNA(Asp) synthetase